MKPTVTDAKFNLAISYNTRRKANILLKNTACQKQDLYRKRTSYTSIHALFMTAVASFLGLLPNHNDPVRESPRINKMVQYLITTSKTRIETK